MKSGRKKGCIPWNKGIPRTDEEKIKIGLSQKGIIRKGSLENLKKGRGWNKGKKMSDDYCKKVSLSCMGRIPGNKKPDTLCKYCKIKLKRHHNTMCIKCYLENEVGNKIKGIKKTPEHREKVSLGRKNSPKVLRGEKHPSWKGGVTLEHEKIRKSSGYKIWRVKCFLRDNYTCQKCGKIGGDLEVHHIKPFFKYKNLRLNAKNGVTLCVPCHKLSDFNRR